MKKFLLQLVVNCFCLISIAQSGELLVKSNAKGLYVEHAAAPKENFYSIGRLYHTHPKMIAAFNGLDMSKGLSIGQTINIPLTDTNFNQRNKTGVPLYYITQGSETISALSVKFSATQNNLRNWNGIQGNEVANGKKIIVGYLTTSEMPDRLVTINRNENLLVAEESVSNVKKQEAAEKKIPVQEVRKDPPPVVEESVSNVKKQEAAEKKIPVQEVKKDPPPVVEESVSNVKKQEAVEKKIPMQEVRSEMPVVIKEEGSGYFKNNFIQQVKSSPDRKEQTVTSSIFKTTSGWQDEKYYMLINDVEPGTIVKITNPSNNRSLFAKVLYPMEKIRENQGVDIRISDAAAALLSITETDKFILKLSY